MASFWDNLAEAMGWKKPNNIGHLSNAGDLSTRKGVGFQSSTRDNYIGGKDIENEALKSLRTGEDYAMPSEGRNIVYSGGIGQGRYLGSGIGDVNNENYFSNKEASDKFNPLRVTMRNVYRDGAPYIGDFTVKYDDDGAIAEIDLESDMNMIYMDDDDRKSNRYRNGTKITGASNISDFFRKLGVASSESNFFIGDRDRGATKDNGEISWYTGQSDEYGKFGRNGISSKDIWAPTAIFGSKGVLNSPINKHGSWENAPTYYGNDNGYLKTWNTVGFGNTRGVGKDAWSKHWREISKKMYGE